MIKEEAKSEYWSMTEGVFNCLIDKERTLAFKKAIENSIEKGDIVVDMGAGTGILSLLAARAGAKKVYAVEIDQKNIENLEKTFQQNGFGEIIEVLEGDVTKIEIPEKVDLIVGEMIATALIEELQIPAMNNVLKYGKPNVKVVLNKFENYIDLVNNNNKFYGYTFDIPRYEYSNEPELESDSFSEKKLFKTIDFSVINEFNEVDEKFVLVVEKDGILNGVRLSSKSIFYDESEFDASFAYSYPIIFPVKDTNVIKGDRFEIKIKYKMCEGWKNFALEVTKL